MITQSQGLLHNLLVQQKLLPVIENYTQFVYSFNSSQISAILLRHCNLFELSGLLEQAFQRKIAVYVSIDHIDGIHADTVGMHYLQKQFHIAGIVSNHARTLVLAKDAGLETIQRIFAADSTGLEMALETIDSTSVDFLDISPALVIPYLTPQLMHMPLPFIASGLIYTSQQVRAVLRSGALGVAVTRSELWR